MGREPPRRPRPADRALALAGDAHRRLPGARASTASGATRRSSSPRGVRRRGRASCASAASSGANVTIPHKEAALALADEASAAARAIGAANTLSFGAGRGRAPRTPTLPGLIAALPADPAGRRRARARRRRRGPGGDLGAARGGRGGRGPQPDRARAERRSPPSSASRRSMPARTAAARGLRPGRQRDLGRACKRRTDGRPRAADAPKGAGRRQPMGSPTVRSWWTSSTGPRRRSSRPQRRQAGATVVDGLEILVRQGAESFRIWTGLGTAAGSDACRNRNRSHDEPA